jgi:hypothetical protein
MNGSEEEEPRDKVKDGKPSIHSESFISVNLLNRQCYAMYCYVRLRLKGSFCMLWERGNGE